MDIPEPCPLLAYCIKAPDGRLLMMFIGPNPSQLEYRFRQDNKSIKWDGYSVVAVSIEEIATKAQLKDMTEQRDK